MGDLNSIFREFALAFIGRLDGADGEIADPERLRRNKLDGSLDSLHVVDEYLAHLHKMSRRIPEDRWHRTVLWGGAYLGEVIRYETAYRFNWVDYNEYMPRHPRLQPILPERTVASCAFLVLPDDFMIMPLNKIARFIDEGPENSVHFFAQCDIARAKQAPQGQTQAG
ncbi:MAG: hypothetical protein MUF51_10220 [Vicinamibacteria bacterium]|nr:hypothetical protein [Vicinamibacteria bacterium]